MRVIYSSLQPSWSCSFTGSALASASASSCSLAVSFISTTNLFILVPDFDSHISLKIILIAPSILWIWFFECEHDEAGGWPQECLPIPPRRDSLCAKCQRTKITRNHLRWILEVCQGCRAHGGNLHPMRNHHHISSGNNWRTTRIDLSGTAHLPSLQDHMRRKDLLHRLNSPVQDHDRWVPPRTLFLVW